jgi:hypothetical protein
MDAFSRILILTASFFSMAALALAIVGIATNFWYYSQDSSGNVLYYNLFTLCTGNVINGSSICTGMPQGTALGIGTQNAASFLVVAICLLGCGMLVILFMNFVQLTGILVFLATLFMVATFAEGSRVTIFNSYSAILVQTSHVLTIFSLGIIAFASGRIHFRYYEQF